jgi:hypothetical protein
MKLFIVLVEGFPAAPGRAHSDSRPWTEVAKLHCADRSNVASMWQNLSFHVATKQKVLSSKTDGVILTAALGPDVYSAYNRNEYQRQIQMFLERRPWPVRGTSTSPPSMAQCYIHCGILNTSQPYTPVRPVT